MTWLCWFKHSWLYIDGFDRRTCLRCKRYQRKVWGGRFIGGGIFETWSND